VILGGIGNIYGVIVGGLVIETADRLFLPALKDFFTNLMNHSVLPALASQKTLHDIVRKMQTNFVSLPSLWLGTGNYDGCAA